MKRSSLCSVVLVLFLSIASAACGDDGGADVDAAPIVLFDAAPPLDAPIPDATPPIDAQLFPLQEAVGVDTADIVGGPAFAALGGFIDLQGQINAGSLLLALEWRDLDDASGQSDDTMAVGFYQCDDPDQNTANNFDVDNPDRWVAQASSVDSSGAPTVLFDTASTTAGVLDATNSTGVVTIATQFLPLPLNDPALRGLMVPSTDSTVVNYLADKPDPDGFKATLSGALLVATLGGTGDPTSGFCGSRDSLLDILALGCSVPGFMLPGTQPDVDRDGDGLEKLCDTCADEPCAAFLSAGELDAGVAGTADGKIECCVDNTDGTPAVTTGVGCWSDAAFADGYSMDIEIHGTRVILMSEVDPT